MKRFKNGVTRFDAADIENAFTIDRGNTPLTEGGRALLESIVATIPELPTDPGTYAGRRGSIFLLNKEGAWFDEDGTPSMGHGNAPEDFVPLVKLVRPIPRHPEDGRFNIGERVSYDHKLFREYNRGRKRFWNPVKRMHAVAGIIVGERTLHNGEVVYGGYDEPTTFHSEERIRAYLVAVNPRHAPSLVLPEHITRLD